MSSKKIEILLFIIVEIIIYNFCDWFYMFIPIVLVFLIFCIMVIVSYRDIKNKEKEFKKRKYNKLNNK